MTYSEISFLKILYSDLFLIKYKNSTQYINLHIMKKSLVFSLLSLAAISSLQAAETITGSTLPSAPALFNDAAAWGGTLPAFDKNLYIQLSGDTDSTLYYDVNGSATVHRITTNPDITANYVIKNSQTDGTLTFDINAQDDLRNDIIYFSLGSYSNSLTIDSGKYAVTSTGTLTGSAATAWISMGSTSAGAGTKGIYIAKDATIDSFVNLRFNGSAGDYGNGINIAGTVNNYDGDKSAWGKTSLYWMVAPYGSGGSRTLVNVQDGGVLNTGTLDIGTRAKFVVQSGGVVNVYDNIEMQYNGVNPNYLTVDAGGTLNVSNSVIFDSTGAAGVTAGGGSTFNANGTVNVGSIDQIKYSNVYVGGNMSVTNGYTLSDSTSVLQINDGGKLTTDLVMNDGKFQISNGGTLKGNLTQLGGTLTLASGSYWEVTGDSSISSALTLTNNITINQNASLTTSANQLKFSGANVTVNGNLTTDYNSGYQMIMSSGKITVNQDGKITLPQVTSSPYAYGIQLDGGELELNTAEGAVKTQKVLLKKGILTIKSKNPFSSPSATKTVIGIAAGSTFVGTINLYADLTVGDIFIQKDSTININFMDANAMIYTGAFRSTGDVGNYVFTNFNNDRIFVTTQSNLDLLTLSGTASNGTVLLDENFYWEATDGGYFLNYNGLVPEPAEWAAIFGAIALLAAVRRRK